MMNLPDLGTALRSSDGRCHGGRDDECNLDSDCERSVLSVWGLCIVGIQALT
jgi:hypothetical protein